MNVKSELPVRIQFSLAVNFFGKDESTCSESVFVRVNSAHPVRWSSFSSFHSQWHLFFWVVFQSRGWEYTCFFQTFFFSFFCFHLCKFKFHSLSIWLSFKRLIIQFPSYILLYETNVVKCQLILGTLDFIWNTIMRYKLLLVACIRSIYTLRLHRFSE